MPNDPQVCGLAVDGDALAVEFLLPGLARSGATLNDLTQEVRDAVRAALDAQELQSCRTEQVAAVIGQDVRQSTEVREVLVGVLATAREEEEVARDLFVLAGTHEAHLRLERARGRRDGVAAAMETLGLAG